MSTTFYMHQRVTSLGAWRWSTSTSVLLCYSLISERNSTGRRCDWSGVKSGNNIRERKSSALPVMTTGMLYVRYARSSVHCFVDRSLFCHFDFISFDHCNMSFIDLRLTVSRICLTYNMIVLLVMKRKFKQWWPTILPISTKRTTTSPSNHGTQEKTTTCTVSVLNTSLAFLTEFLPKIHLL
jgi:hypothetical protein